MSLARNRWVPQAEMGFIPCLGPSVFKRSPMVLNCRPKIGVQLFEVPLGAVELRIGGRLVVFFSDLWPSPWLAGSQGGPIIHWGHSHLGMGQSSTTRGSQVVVLISGVFHLGTYAVLQPVS